MLPPNHISRSPEEIVSTKLYYDSVGYIYRAMSWLDYFEQHRRFTALLYTCIEARYGIEYLMFEEIVISTGANLSKDEYEKLLKNSTKLLKALKRISPDYEKLQEFTNIIASLTPNFPRIVQWNPNKLMKSWGVISNYLHWCGSKDRTTEAEPWLIKAGQAVRAEIEPIWLNISSGQSAIMHPKDMHPRIRELWYQYKSNEVDLEGVKIRMQILKPILEPKYA